MNTYEFSMILGGVNAATAHLEDSLFEAGCNDGMICTYNSTVYIEFSREADSYKKAIVSAVKDIESSSIKAKVISVDAGGLVGLSDVAALTKISKQLIALLKDGKRGPGTFPSPIQRIKGKQPLWRWSEVANWLHEQGKIGIILKDNAFVTDAMNRALDERKMDPLVDEFKHELAVA
jgi:predicted DNA-binding transcriptional regulator AlpA